MSASAKHEHRPGEIFVFGSNLAGRHGRGAARTALLHHGAIYGQGIGPQGRSYAIPTKDAELGSLSLLGVHSYVLDFLAYADWRPQLNFFLTRIGCGLAGYKDRDIAPMFKHATPNIRKPPGW